MRVFAFVIALLLIGAAQTATATPPPPPFCEVHPEQCHRLLARTRAHFVGLLREVARAVPKVPGYQCHAERTHVSAVGYGRSERRAAPPEMWEVTRCFHPGTNPRKPEPDVVITVSLSMQPTTPSEVATRDKQHDLLVFRDPSGVGLVFGKLREWRDQQGVVHPGSDPSRPPTDSYFTEKEIAANAPYLVSAIVRIDGEPPSARDAFAAGLDRAAIAALRAREDRRRKADREAMPIADVLE